jgi:hypothetical protein
MSNRLAIVVSRAAARQLKNPAVQKALSALALAAVERLTHNSIEKLRCWERRLRRYDKVIDCEWWEGSDEQPPER